MGGGGGGGGDREGGERAGVRGRGDNRVVALTCRGDNH